MPRESWTVRLFEPGDAEEANELYNLAFGKSRPLKDWYWKFDENPESPEKVIAVAKSEGRIVGLYCCLPRRFKVGDGVRVAVQPVENCIHPDHRGGRMQAALWQAARERTINLGIAFGFGFPNEGAYRLGKRLLAYRDLSPLRLLFRRLNWRLGAARRLRTRALDLPIGLVGNAFYRVLLGELHRGTGGGVRIERITDFDAGFDRLWERASARYAMIGVRDRRYLQWRYVRNPEGPFAIFAARAGEETVGYLAVRIVEEGGERVGHVLDLFSEDRPGADEGLLRGGLIHLLEEDVDYVRCAMLAHTPQCRALRAQGFTERYAPQPVVFQAVDEGLDMEMVFREPNWFLTQGDSDYFG